MTLAIAHAFVSAIADDPAATAAGEVTPSKWNETHALTGADEGAIPFGNSASELEIDASNLYWDNTGKTLIVGEQGTEAGGVNINGVVFQAALKISDISSSNPAQVSLHRHSTTLPPVIVASRSNSNTSGHTAVTNSMPLFQLYGAGWTSGHYDLFGAIEIGVDSAGTVSGTSSPGALKFYTAANGSNALTERMKIDSAGDVTLANALKVAQGGTGATTLASGGLLIGNGTGEIQTDTLLTWDTTNNCLIIGTTSPSSSVAGYDLWAEGGNARLAGFLFTQDIGRIKQTGAVATGFTLIAASDVSVGGYGGDFTLLSGGGDNGGNFDLQAGMAQADGGYGGGFSFAAGGSNAANAIGGGLYLSGGGCVGSGSTGGDLYLTPGPGVAANGTLHITIKDLAGNTRKLMTRA